MNRRRLLQALNAMGTGIILPSSECYGEGVSVITPPTTTPPVALESLVKLPDSSWDIPKVGMVAIGGIGCAILSNLSDRLPYLGRSIAINTDASSLNQVKADRKIRLGDGRSFPLDPRAVRRLVQSSISEITDAVAGLDMVFLVVGIGGAADKGIAPLVAQILREHGILTLAFASLPSSSEKQQSQQAVQTAIRKMQLRVDAILPFYDRCMAQVDGENASFAPVSTQVALAIEQLWHGILNPVCRPGLVNVDFDDLKHLILSQEGDCAFGFGSASSAEAAALKAIDHPHLGPHRLQRATAILVTVRAPTGVLKLGVSTSAMRGIRKLLIQDPWIVFAAYHDDTHGDGVAVSVLASGI